MEFLISVQGSLYFIHPQTPWKILNLYVSRSGVTQVRNTNEMTENELHCMDHLLEILQLKMIV